MNQKIQIAVVGMGNMGKTHTAKLQQIPEAQVAAVCSTHPEETQAFLAAQGLFCPVYTDFERMLQEIRLDAVYICLPPYGHSGQVESAAAKGLHIFIEKPIALDVSRGQSMADAVEKSGVYSQVGYHMRHGAMARRLHELISSGEAGRPTLFSASYECNCLHSPWWMDVSRSGGQVFEQVIHLYDMAQYLMGSAVSVSGRTANLLHGSVPGYTVEDTSVSSIAFASGALGCITGSNCAVPGQWNARFRLVCQFLTAEVQDHNHGRILFTDGRSQSEEIISQDDDVLLMESRKFIDTILGKAAPFAPISEGFSDLRLVQAVMDSSRNGGAVITL